MLPRLPEAMRIEAARGQVGAPAKKFELSRRRAAKSPNPAPQDLSKGSQLDFTVLTATKDWKLSADPR
jgi:hypothetical protein